MNVSKNTMPLSIFRMVKCQIVVHSALDIDFLKCTGRLVVNPSGNSGGVAGGMRAD